MRVWTYEDKRAQIWGRVCAHGVGRAYGVEREQLGDMLTKRGRANGDISSHSARVGEEGRHKMLCGAEIMKNFGKKI